VVLVGFPETILDEQIDYLGVSLDQAGHVGIIRSLDHPNTLVRLFHTHLNFIGVPKDLGEQGISHVNRSHFLDPTVHRCDMLLDLCGDFRIVGFGQRFDAIVPFGHGPSDLIVVLQEIMKNVTVLHETRILSSRSTASATPVPASAAKPWPSLREYLAG
jgi:hypothetical protein